MLLLDLFEDFQAIPRRIEWIRPHDGEDYQPIWIDVAALDASWRKDRYGYVSPGGGDNAIGRRYADFGTWLGQDEPVKMSEVSFNAWFDCVTFGNGRHRFAWLRDHGVTVLPVLVGNESAEVIRERFGTTQRASVLPAQMPGQAIVR